MKQSRCGFLNSIRSLFFDCVLPRRLIHTFFLQLGERGSGLRSRGQVQDFYELRAQCVQEGTLFEDPEFLCEDSSLFFSNTRRLNFQWLRPMVFTIIHSSVFLITFFFLSSGNNRRSSIFCRGCFPIRRTAGRIG